MAMFIGRTWTLLTVLLTVQLSAVCGKIESQNAQKQSLLIEETMETALEQLLNIHPSKWKTKTVSSEGKSVESLMPSYMKDLYQKYSKGYVPKSSKRHTNTIRSILPVKGNIQGEEMLLFNLTSVSSWQDIVYTEVHFFQRRYQSPDRKRYKLIPLPQEYRLEVFDIHGLAVTSLGKWKLGKGRRGWQVQDLTGPVQKIRQHAEPPHLLGFKIQIAQVGNKHRKYHSAPLKSVLRMDPSPFLIIFSNESNSNGTPSSPVESTLEPIRVSVAGKGDSILQYTLADSAKPKSNRKRTQRSLEDNRIEEIDYSSIPRTARSIHDNELPDLDGFSNYIPQSHPNMLQIRAPKLKKPVSKPKTKTTTTTPKPKTIPYPKGFSAASYAQKWISDKKRKARKNKRRHRKLPEAWHYTQQSYGNEARHEAPEDYGNSLCQRRKFVVDFAEIGWSEWIISPKSFEAHYCTGKCPFPLNKPSGNRTSCTLNPSNHATIQSIVHAIGLHPEVPAPCCVPDVMSSVTLLYFDDDRNVVLKNYPSMTAETCACR